jgi:hypothetical protein
MSMLSYFNHYDTSSFSEEDNMLARGAQEDFTPPLQKIEDSTIGSWAKI